MKTYLLTFILLIAFAFIGFSQKKSSIIAEVKNNEVKVILHKLIEFKDADPKSGSKFLIADITLENISDKSIQMGADYTMNITIKDNKGNEYRSGLKGEGILSSYLSKEGSEEQDSKAHNLSFSDTFPQKTKARSLLCGFKVPVDSKIISFGVKKKNLWSTIK